MNDYGAIINLLQKQNRMLQCLLLASGFTLLCDNTNTTFRRSYSLDANSNLVITDTDLDGNPFTPANPVGVCN